MSTSNGVVVIDVCVACREERNDRLSGQELYDALAKAIQGSPAVEIRPVQCFAVCNRPVTLALRKRGGWSYLLGDVTDDVELDEILAAAAAVARSDSGVPPLKERPAFFRRGVIGRLPPVASGDNGK